MKRVPLTHKDYPENFNKLAKYIGRNWIDKKLSLEASRQLLAVAIGYNSVHELEKSFIQKLPNLIDVDALIRQIKRRLNAAYEKQQQAEDEGYYVSREKWRGFEEDIFPKIPFYLLEALDKSKEDVFDGVYDQVADRMSLLIQNYRYGGYYGIFVPYADALPVIDDAIDYDKSSNLISFFDEYECFPYGRGGLHISVITEIRERIERYFDDAGNWKMRVLDPDGHALEYYEVINEILSWFRAADKTYGTPWRVIDDKKSEGHWLFKALDDATAELKENNYKRVEPEEEETVNETGNGPLSQFFILDEAHAFVSPGFANLLALATIRVPDTRRTSGIKDPTGKPIREGDLVIDERGKEYKVDLHPKSKTFFIFETGNIDNQVLLSNFDGQLTIKDPRVVTQSFDDLKT